MKWLSIPIPGECGLPMFGDDVVVIDDFNTTSEGSYFDFTCADGLSPTAIIRTICSPSGSWNPDPAHAICVNTSTNPTTGIDGTPPPVSLTILTVICSIAFFVVGLVGGIACGSLVIYCCNRDKHDLQPSQPPPAPFYEAIILPAKEELELKDNVAYGHSF